MRVDWLVPATSAEVSDDGTMNIFGGGVDTLVVSDTSRLSSLGIVLATRIAGLAQDWLTDHRVTVWLGDASGSEVLIADERVSIPEAQLLAPEREIGLLLPLSCRWFSPEVGVFTLTVRLDDECVERVPLAVVESAPIEDP